MLYANGAAKSGIVPISSVPAHAVLSHQTSLTKCKFKDTVIKNFKKAAGHSDSCLWETETGGSLEVRISRPA